MQPNGLSSHFTGDGAGMPGLRALQSAGLPKNQGSDTSIKKSGREAVRGSEQKVL